MGISARLPSGGAVFGGWTAETPGASSGSGVLDTCGSVIFKGDNPNSLRFCDEFAFPKVWQHEFKLSGAYPLPWYGIQLAGALQAYPGNTMGEYWYFSRNRFLPSQYSRYDPRWYSDVNCVAPCTIAGTYVQSADRTRQYGTGSQGINHALLPFETVNPEVTAQPPLS